VKFRVLNSVKHTGFAKSDIVIACHTESNGASGRIMEKAGMKFDAILPNYFVNKKTGKREGQVYYSVQR